MGLVEDAADGKIKVFDNAGLSGGRAAESDGVKAHVIDEEMGSKIQISSEEDDYEDGSEEVDDNGPGDYTIEGDNSIQINQSSTAFKIQRQPTSKKRKKGKGAKGKGKNNKKQQIQKLGTLQTAQDNVKLFNNLNEMATLSPGRRVNSTNLETAATP